MSPSVLAEAACSANCQAPLCQHRGTESHHNSGHDAVLKGKGKLMGDDITYRGPLGSLALAEAGAAGFDPADLYLAAVSWWSAAVAPAVSLSAWPGLTTVWTALVHRNTPEADPLLPLLQRLLDGISPLAVHADVTTERQFDAATHATQRAVNAGKGTSSMLLTGSPFTTNRGRPNLSWTLQGPLRLAWEREHMPPTRGKARFRGPSERLAPPDVASLWTPSIAEWQGFQATDAATYSRVLHFSTRPVDIPPISPESDTWQEELALAYAWAFNTRPFLRFSKQALRLRNVIRRVDGRWDEPADPHADFFVRIDDHVVRIAGTLAASERTTVASAHVEAAWNLARRAVRDTSHLIDMDTDMW